MNIQSRKLVLIEEFLRISDEELISKLESFLKQEKKALHERNLKPMSLNEFQDLIEEAKQDFDAGRVTSHADLTMKVEKWK